MARTVSGQKMETVKLASKLTGMSVRAKTSHPIPPKYQVPLEVPRVLLEPVEEQAVTMAPTVAVPPTTSGHEFGTSNLSSLV